MEKLKSIIWDELNVIQNNSDHCASCEIAGALSSLSAFSEGFFTNLFSRRLFLFRRLKNLWDGSEWSTTGDFSSRLVIPVDMKGRVSLTMESAILHKFLTRFGTASRSSLDSWNWLRGVFASSGSLFLPRTGYYLVFRLPASSRADLERQIKKVLKTSVLSLRLRLRSGFREIVIRDQSAIVDMLSNMRLFRSSLILEEKAMLRSMRDRANKIVNCDSSNIRRTVEAAERQLRIAKILMVEGAISSLPADLKDVIAARIEHPTATLRELGQHLDRPVSKSTVEYRWRKIEQLATRIFG